MLPSTHHPPTHLHPFIKYQQPTGWREILNSHTCLEFQKKDNWATFETSPPGLYSSSSPRPRAFRPYAAVVLCVHLTSPSRPAAILPLWPHLPKGSVKSSLVSAWANVGELPGLRIWSPLRGKSARMTTQSTGSATGRQTYPRDAGSSKDRCLHWGLVRILVLTPL